MWPERVVDQVLRVANGRLGGDQAIFSPRVVSCLGLIARACFPFGSMIKNDVAIIPRAPWLPLPLPPCRPFVRLLPPSPSGDLFPRSLPFPGSRGLRHSLSTPSLHRQEHSTSFTSTITFPGSSFSPLSQQSYRFISRTVRKHNHRQTVDSLPYNTPTPTLNAQSTTSTCPTTATTTMMPCRGPPRSRGDRVPPCQRTSLW